MYSKLVETHKSVFSTTSYNWGTPTAEEQEKATAEQDPGIFLSKKPRKRKQPQTVSEIIDCDSSVLEYNTPDILQANSKNYQKSNYYISADRKNY